MLASFSQKSFSFLFSIFITILLTFIIMKSIPGDPFMDDNLMSEEVLKSLHSYYGLDKPILIQFFYYLKGLLSGDLGPSYIYTGRSVNQIIAQGFPISFLLGMQALSIAFIGGTIMGSLASFFHRRSCDRVVMGITTIAISFPPFLLATLLQFVLAIKWHLFPIARYSSYLHTILPSLSLAAMPMAYIARLIRVNMVEVMHQDYILLARSKGVGGLRLIIYHCLRNSMLPVIGYLGPIAAQIVTGSFAVEKIFGIPGLGQWLIHSIGNRDYTVIMGTTLVFSLILITFSYISELGYMILDPRLRKAK